MKKIFCMLIATILFVSSMSVSAFALTTAESNAQLAEAYNALFASVAGDVNNDGKFDALDARTALLASVGVKEEGIRESAADMDGDGVVTTIDVRALLRFSAKLDPLDNLYSAADKFNLFNAFANNIIPTNQKFHYTSMSKNVDMSYTNASLINTFNRQMNRIPGIDETIDLGAELQKDKGKTIYSCNTSSLYTATERSFAFKDSNIDLVSFLTLSDISSITYSSNQSYDFVPKRTSGDRVQEITANKISMTGLDKLTVTFSAESLKTLPEDTKTLKHGKIFFNMPQQDELSAGYKDIDDMFSDLSITGGSMDVKVSPKNIKFHDSSVSIYFDRDSKSICAMEYNLYYDYTVNLDMDINVPILLLDIDDNTDIVDKEYVQYVYCFPKNYVA